MGILDVRRNSVFDKFKKPKYGISPLDWEQEEDEDPFVSPTESTFKAPKLDRGYEPISEELSPSGKGATEKDWITRLKEEYRPETAASDRFNQLLGEFPEREEPSWQRKLVAGGMALGNTRRKQPMGGIETAEQVMYAPFEREKADWKEKAQPFYNAANLERQQNIQERQLLGQGLTAEVAQNKIAEQGRIADEKNRIANIRAAAYALKQQRYDIKVLGDEVVGFGPNGERVSLGSSGGMDKAEQIALEGKQDMEIAKQRAASSLANTQAAGGQVILIDGRPFAVNPRVEGGLAGLPPGTATRLGTDTGDSPTDISKTRGNAFQQVYDNYPQYRKYISPPTTANGTWQLVDPPTQGWSFKGTWEKEMKDYNDLRRLLSGAPPPAQVNPAQVNPPPVSPQATSGLGPTQVPAQVPAEIPGATGQVSPNMQRGRSAPSFMGPQQPQSIFPENAPNPMGNRGRRATDIQLPAQAPPTEQQLPPGAIIRRSKVDGRMQMSIDNGQSWMDYRPPAGQ